MRKLFTCCFLILPLLFAGCSSTKPKDPANAKKITSQEYIALLDFARQALANYNEGMISKEDKRTIMTAEPKFNVSYETDKSGMYDFTWSLNNKVINYLGDGNLTDPQNSFKSIVVITTSVGTGSN